MDAKLYHEIHKRSGDGDFTQTYTALIAGIRYLFDRKDDIPDSLRERIFDDIKDLGIDSQNKNFRDIKWGEISLASLDDGNALAENIGKHLPQADLNFISECLPFRR